MDSGDDVGGFSRNFFQCATGANIAAFHAQDTGLLTRNNVRRVGGADAVFKAKILDETEIPDSVIENFEV